jgi:DNA-binding MarR family transcriptional regulator
MGHILRRRLRQERFDSPAHEAMLNVLVTAAALQRRIDAVCDLHGLTAAQYNVLRILKGVHPAGHPRCEIAARMIDRAPDVTRLVDRLARAGLVRRTVSVMDRRQSPSVITPAGLRLLERMTPAMAATTEPLARRLDRGDSERLSELCERIYGPDENTTT